jgi:hypothetical protein
VITVTAHGAWTSPPGVMWFGGCCRLEEVHCIRTGQHVGVDVLPTRAGSPQSPASTNLLVSAGQ